MLARASVPEVYFFGASPDGWGACPAGCKDPDDSAALVSDLTLARLFVEAVEVIGLSPAELALPAGFGASPAGCNLPACSADLVSALTLARLLVDVPAPAGEEALTPGPWPAGASEFGVGLSCAHAPGMARKPAARDIART